MFGGNDNHAALLHLVKTYCEAPSRANKAKLYEYVIQNPVVSLIDPLLQSLAAESRLNHHRLFELARSLAAQSPDRETVKLGIALLGLFRSDDNLEIFRTLGRHDEFTMYCGVALENTADEPEGELGALRRMFTAGVELHIVERLESTNNAEIKEWLLRDGYKNSVMYEYLAYTCATTGGLLAF